MAIASVDIDVTMVLDEASRLSDLILQSEEAKHYRNCRHQLEHDPEARQLIQRFVQKKEDFEEVQRFGKYHPDYKRIRKEMREMKRTLDLNDKVAQFKKAEKELESILNEVSQFIGYAVSEDIKVPTGNPFWDSVGCGGNGCGSGGCGNCG